MKSRRSNANYDWPAASRLDAATLQALRGYIAAHAPEGVPQGVQQLCEPPMELTAYLAKRELPFSQYLLGLIRQSGESESEIYKRAHVDRRLFSKIRSDPDYRPAKSTVIAFALALRLSPDATRKLLASAGFALSESAPFDLIIRYFVERGEYDFFLINDALHAFDQPILMM